MQTEKPQVSIIVPAYNAVVYVTECVESILTQRYADYEVVLVDDGSTDGTGVLLDALAGRDSRIRVIHQANGGVTSARRKGVEEARGEWIYFVDADDKLIPDGLIHLTQVAMQDDALDIVEGCVAWFDADGIGEGMPALVRETHREVRHTNPASYARGLFQLGRLNEAAGSPWGKLLRREILLRTNALDIPRHFTNAEDTLMLLLMARGIRKHIMVDKEVYLYRRDVAMSASTNRHTTIYWCEWLEFAWDNIFSSRLPDWEEAWKSICCEIFKRLTHSGQVKRVNDLTPFFYQYVVPFVSREKKSVTSSTTKCYLFALSRRRPCREFFLRILAGVFYFKNRHQK